MPKDELNTTETTTEIILMPLTARERNRLMKAGGAPKPRKKINTDDMNDRVLAGLAWEEERARCVALAKVPSDELNTTDRCASR